MAGGNEHRATNKSRSMAVRYEVLLQEMLSAAGVLDIPAGQQNVRKLACHMALLGELVSAHAFGSLQHIMTRIIEEVNTCMYTGTVCAISAPQILDYSPSDRSKIHRVPYFAEYDSIQDEMVGLRDATSKSHDLCQNAQNQFKSASKKLISAKVNLGTRVQCHKHNCCREHTTSQVAFLKRKSFFLVSGDNI